MLESTRENWLRAHQGQQHQAGVSTELANVGGSRTCGIKQGQVAQEVLHAAGEMLIQSHPTPLWFPEGEHGLQGLLYPWALSLPTGSKGHISSRLGLPKGEWMGHGRGHGGAGGTVLSYLSKGSLSSPCCGVGGFWDQEGKERAGARVEVPRQDFFTTMK